MKGFSTLEIMIAVVIITITMIAVVQVSLELPLAVTESSERLQATELANSQLQKQFALGLTSFSAVTATATTSLTIENQLYQTSVNVDLEDDLVTKQLTSTVSWINTDGHTESVTLNGLVTDFEHAYPSECPDIASGNWSTPSEVTLIMPGPVQSLSINNVAENNGNNELVASVTTALTKTSPTLFNFSLSSSTSPTLISSFDNSTSTKSGPAATANNWPITYIANSAAANFDTCVLGTACSQLQIIDWNGIGSSSAPYMRSLLKLATSTASFASGSGGQSAGKSITYSNGFIYLGLQKTSSVQGNEFNIIDVHNPDSPVWLSGFHIGRTVNHIEIQNGYAYLATDDPTRELVILDIHNPLQIMLVGSYDAPGPSNYGYGEAVSIASTTVLLGRSYAPGQSQLTELTASPPQAPIVIGRASMNVSTDTSSIESIQIESSLAFVLTSLAIEIWKVAPNSSLNASTTFSLLNSIPLPNASSVTNASLACHNKSIYVASTNAAHVGYMTILTGS